MEGNLVSYQPITSDIKKMIAVGQDAAYNAVSRAMLMTYWNIGKRLVEEEQNEAERAEYGKRLIPILSETLTKEFGSNYSDCSLRYYRKFYLYFRDFEIWNARVPNLNWSHFRALLRVSDEDARIWYMNEAADENWSVRTLDRNIGTQYYYRLLHSPKKEVILAKMQEDTTKEPKNKFELFKSPIVAGFLGFRIEDSFAESDLESAILSHIRDFLMEMGRGFAFVARQQHIVTDTEYYYIDLVFYNIELKCYVLIDLKMGTITHQDVGQIDMYVRMYDELKCKDGECKVNYDKSLAEEAASLMQPYMVAYYDKLTKYFKQVKEIREAHPDFFSSVSDLKTVKPLIDISEYEEDGSVLDYKIKRVSRLKKTPALYLYKMFLEYRGRMPYISINLTGYSMVSTTVRYSKKEYMTTVYVKLTNSRKYNMGNQARLAWYVKKDDLQSAIKELVDSKITLKYSDTYIKLDKADKIPISCKKGTIFLKKAVKQDVYTIEIVKWDEEKILCDV